MYLFVCLAAVAIESYLLGCFNGSIIISQMKYHMDVREFGSKNAGLTNFSRVFGKKNLPLVLLIDAFKAVIATGIAKVLTAPLLLSSFGVLFATFFCMLGHIFPVFYDFRGGKGVLTAFSSMLVFDWKIALALLAAYLFVYKLTGYSSLGSLVGGALALILIVLSPQYGIATFIMTVLCLILMFWMHRSNISRLRIGSESRFSFSSKAIPNEAERVLVVVDMQRDFTTDALRNPEAIAVIPKVAELARNFDGEVIFLKDTHPESYMETIEGRHLPVPHCLRGSEGWELVPELEAVREEREAPVVEKPSFGSTLLPALIRARCKENPEITLCGVCTDICVISNALILKAHFPDSEIRVKADCCAGVTPESHDAALKQMTCCHIDLI